MSTSPPRKRWRVSVLLPALFGLIIGGAGYLCFLPSLSRSPAVPMMPAEPPEASVEQVHQFCGACHAYPPPDTFPRSAWRKEVKQGYDFAFKAPALRLDFPPLESVVRYYERRAPAELPPLVPHFASVPLPVSFERQGFPLPDDLASPAITHVSLVQLFDGRGLDLLVCDTARDQVLALKFSTQPPAWQVLARGLCGAHAVVIDLDGDGFKDVLVAGLGSFYATDDRVGSVVWLRGSTDGRFTPVPLLEGVGRVADVQAADFTGDGNLDLIVAVFGWRQTGSILLLENRTADWSKPVFVPRILDDRPGTIHVPVCDLNQDGRPDFVALLSQEHETVVAFLNMGGGCFRKETIWTAPHPAYGVSGLQLVDLDGDGDLDVLLTNGDALDAPYLLKPYHGVQWLENRGTFPFTLHRLTDFHGVSRAVAADLDGDGDLDVLAVSYLPAPYYPERERLKLEAVIVLEQVAPAKFVRHSLETATCDHLTCAVGDVNGDGRPDLVVGNAVLGNRTVEAITVWKNQAWKRP